MSIENQTLNRTYATTAWGLLLIWWGLSIMVGPITIGMSAIGTGLIFIGVNVARSLKGIPFNNSNYLLGFIAIVWGTFDHALGLNFWTSFAVLLIVTGVVIVFSLLAHPRTV